jgi:hypothetical protein
VPIIKPAQKHKYNIKTVHIYKKENIEQVKQKQYGSTWKKTILMNYWDKNPKA